MKDVGLVGVDHEREPLGSAVRIDVLSVAGL